MTIWRSAGPLLNEATQTTTVSKWLLAAAMIGVGLTAPILASRVAAPIEHVRSAPIIKVIVPSGAESTRAIAAASAAPPSPPAFSDATFRFGFLEFEDDPDAPSKCTAGTATTVPEKAKRL